MTTHHQLRELRVNGHTIAIVERTETQTSSASGHHWYAASKTPVAIIVRRHGESRTFDLDGTPIDPGELPIET